MSEVSEGLFVLTGGNVVGGFLNPGLAIRLSDGRTPAEDAPEDFQAYDETYDYPGGVQDFVDLQKSFRYPIL